MMMYMYMMCQYIFPLKNYFILHCMMKVYLPNLHHWHCLDQFLIWFIICTYFPLQLITYIY